MRRPQYLSGSVFALLCEACGRPIAKGDDYICVPRSIGTGIFHPNCYGKPNKGNNILDCVLLFGNARSAVSDWKSIERLRANDRPRLGKL